MKQTNKTTPKVVCLTGALFLSDDFFLCWGYNRTETRGKRQRTLSFFKWTVEKQLDLVSTRLPGARWCSWAWVSDFELSILRHALPLTVGWQLSLSVAHNPQKSVATLMRWLIDGYRWTAGTYKCKATLLREGILFPFLSRSLSLCPCACFLPVLREPSWSSQQAMGSITWFTSDELISTSLWHIGLLLWI